MNQESEKQPQIFLYSLLLPLFWFLTGGIFSFLLPDLRLGVFGLLIIIYSAIAPISWYFAKTFRRLFTTSEKIRLIIYFTIWAILCESLALLYVISLDSASTLDNSGLIVTFAITYAVDAVFMALGVHFVGDRMVKYFLNNHYAQNA